jgi:hypothetical protein
MAKRPTYTLGILKNVLPKSDLDEVRKISLTIREETELYQKNELSQILIIVSNRLVHLCSSPPETS